MTITTATSSHCFALLKRVFMLAAALMVLALPARGQATITVNTTLDTVTINDGVCTLREAINNANANGQTTGSDCTAGIGTTDVIEFNIPGAGVHTIQPNSILPSITDGVTIDGYSQPGASENTLATGSDAVLLIEIDGTNTCPTVVHGLFIFAANSTVRGLVINRFCGSGIVVTTSGNTIQGNFIGTSADGTTDLGNGGSGVVTNGGGSNVMGGTLPAERNIISGNTANGIAIVGAGATNNTVQGNYIGTDAAGTTMLGNSAHGVWINGIGPNQIGGTAEGAENVISSNGFSGVWIGNAGATGNIVEGNLIGTDVTGTLDFGNMDVGVNIASGALTNTIGGTTAGAGNLLSGNTNHGISINNSASNTIQGNFIGTNLAGTGALGNTFFGVAIIGASSTLNQVGGTVTGARNVISGNDEHGVFISTSATANTVQGNYIGTNAAGSGALANGVNGVAINDNATNNTIGGTGTGAENVISGNTNQGILISGVGTTGNMVEGNLIGTNSAGTAPLPNGEQGILLFETTTNTIGGAAADAGNIISGNGVSGILISDGSSNTVQGNIIGTDAAGTLTTLGNTNHGVDIIGNSPSNQIGGTASGAGNLISGNGGAGVRISSANASGNIVEGNLIGTTGDGIGDLGNVSNGVAIVDAPSNQIGGTATDAGNVISGNNANGVALSGTGSTGNMVEGNLIGTNATGTGVVGNSQRGVSITGGATSTMVGGTAAGAENVISGNGTDGIRLGGSTTMSNTIQGNLIGTDIAGTSNLGNGGNGVSIGGASMNQVGGTAADEPNIIAFNVANGVDINGSDATDNAVLSNSIFENTGLGINLDGAGATANDAGDSDDGPNHLQNTPVITAISDVGGGNFDVTYSVDTNPSNATYPLRVEFFVADMNDQEGETFIDFDTYSAGDFATGEKTVTLTPGGPFSALVATATDDDGNTSEFSVPMPVIVATKTYSLSEGDDGIAQPGETISYTIEISNGGSGSTSGFVFADDALDTSLALACATVMPTPDNCTDGLGGSFSYDPGTLAELATGDTLTITFDAVVENPISAGVESVSNQGTVSGDNFEDVLTDDPDDPTSDADPTVIPVDAAVVVMATKTDALVIDKDSDGKADPGDTIEYTITVTNTGDQDIENVTVSDTVDPNTELECPVNPGPGTQVSCTPGAGGTFVVNLTAVGGDPLVLVPKASESLTIRVVVVEPFPANAGTVENQATVEYTGESGPEQTFSDDPDTSAPMDPTVTEIDGAADLWLTKTASTSTPDYLDEVTFTLTIENLGPVNGGGADVKDELPKGLTFVSASGDGDYNAETGRWSVAGIEVGSPASIDITALVETIEPTTNTAAITKTRLRDENPSNNSASATITPVASDLAVEKRLSAYSEDASIVTATFVLTATNDGPSNATGVVVTDLLDDDATLVSVGFSDGSDTYNATIGAWTIGSLPVGATATLTMTITADARTFVLNTALVAGEQPDQNSRNNLAGVVIGRGIPDPARFRSDLSLTKTVSETSPALGEEVVYTLVVTNGGPFTTAGVEVTDLLPSGVTFVSATTSDEADSYDETTGVWLVGALPDGAIAQLQITVEVTGTGEITNTAEVTSNHLPDPDSETDNDEPGEDDQASATMTVSGEASEKATDAEQAETAAGVPTDYALYGNYPNPFNPSTTIPYGVPESGEVRLAVYDVLGREVAVLVSGTVAAGRYEVVWEAGTRQTGVYLVRMEAAGRVYTQRVTLMK